MPVPKKPKLSYSHLQALASGVANYEFGRRVLTEGISDTALDYFGAEVVDVVARDLDLYDRTRSILYLDNDQTCVLLDLISEQRRLRALSIIDLAKPIEFVRLVFDLEAKIEKVSQEVSDLERQVQSHSRDIDEHASDIRNLGRD